MSSGRTGPSFSPPKRKQKPPKAFPLWILPALGPCNGGSCRYAPKTNRIDRCTRNAWNFCNGCLSELALNSGASRVQRGPLHASKSAPRKQAI